MGGEAEYYIPENIEDETLRYVASLVKEVLKENDILENIIQKHIMAYSKTLNENSSSKSLQVMNQNRKLFFSTITPSGVIRSPSPRCSSVGAKKDAKATCIVIPHHKTPVKTKRIGPCKERKRLSFDVEDNERMQTPVKAFVEDFDGDQMSINTTSSFFNNADEAKPNDKAEGIPEWFYSPVIQDQIAENALTKSSNKDQTIIPDLNKDEASMNCNKEEGKAWYLQKTTSIFSFEKVPKASDSPDKFVEIRFNIEGKPETMTSQDTYYLDDENLKREIQDDEAIAVNPENQKSTTENYEIKKGTSSRCLPFKPPFPLSEEEVNVADKHNTDEQDSAYPDKKLKSISSLSVEQLETSSMPYKTPEKFQTATVMADKEDRTPKKQIMAEKAIATNGKECSSPVKDVKTSNKQNMKKRKSVDEPEEAASITSLITEGQKLKVPSNISKLKHELMINDEKDIISAVVSDMSGNDSFCSTNDSPMDVNSHLHSVHNSDMDDDGYDKASELNTELSTNEEATRITSLITEDQELKELTKMSKFNHKSLTSDEEVSANVSIMSGNGSFCSTNDSPMDINHSLHSVDNSDMDDNGSDKITNLNTLLCTNVRKDIISAVVSDTSGNDSFCSTNDSPMDVNNPLHSVDNSDMDDNGCDKTTKLNTTLLTNDEKDISGDISVRNGNYSICSSNDSPMDVNTPFLSADNSFTDHNDSSNSPHRDLTVGQNIVESDGKSIKPVIHINTCKNMSATSDIKMSADYSEEATMAKRLITTEDKNVIKLSNISELKNDNTANDNKFTISADHLVINGNTCSIDEPPLSPMDVTNPFHSAIDCNEAFDHPDSDCIIDQDIAKSHNGSIMPAVHIINNDKSIPVTPLKKSEMSTNQMSETQNCISHFTPKAGQKEMEAKITSDNRNSKRDRGKTDAQETKYVESLTNLMQNLSPSEKCSFDYTSPKSMTGVSFVDNSTSIGKRSSNDFFKKQMTHGAIEDNSTPMKKRTPDDSFKKLVTRRSVGDNASSIIKYSPDDIFKKPLTPGSTGGYATPVKKRSSGDAFSNPTTPGSVGDDSSSVEKRSSDDIFKKPITSASIGGNSSSAEKLRLQYNVLKTVTPPQECLISSQLSNQAAKFLEYLKQREARFSMYLHLFIEDKQDLWIICEHIERLTCVLEIQLSDDQSYVVSVLNFLDKARKTILKGNSWLSYIGEDVKAWENCIRKVNEIQQKVKQFCRETKLDRTPKDFKDLEARFRRVNKIADDMILVREVKRPSIIQFGYEVESLHQEFIHCMLAVGLLIPSSEISSD